MYPASPTYIPSGINVASNDERGRPRRWKAVVALLAAIGGFFAGHAVYRAAVANPRIDLEGYAAGKTSVVHTSEHGRYSAAFPAEPKVEIDSMTVAGMTLTFTMATSEGSNGAVQVAYVDYPAYFARFRGAQLDRVLRGGADGAAANVPGGTLISARYTRMGSRRALHYRISSDDLSLDGELFLVGSRLYVLQTGGPGGAPRAFTRLVQSFRLVSAS